MDLIIARHTYTTSMDHLHKSVEEEIYRKISCIRGVGIMHSNIEAIYGEYVSEMFFRNTLDSIRGVINAVNDYNNE